MIRFGWMIIIVGLCLSLVSAVETPDAVVERGLAALAEMQRADGGYGETSAVTALAGMAFLSGGHSPTRGSYSPNSARCLKAVLEGQDPVTGFLGDKSGTMYAHGFVPCIWLNVMGCRHARD